MSGGADEDDGRPFTSLCWQALLIVKRLRDGTPHRVADFDNDEEETGIVIELPAKSPAPPRQAPGLQGKEEKAPCESKAPSAGMPAREPRLLDGSSE
jgi:hypothetical protein